MAPSPPVASDPGPHRHAAFWAAAATRCSSKVDQKLNAETITTMGSIVGLYCILIGPAAHLSRWPACNRSFKENRRLLALQTAGNGYVSSDASGSRPWRRVPSQNCSGFNAMPARAPMLAGKRVACRSSVLLLSDKKISSEGLEDAKWTESIGRPPNRS